MLNTNNNIVHLLVHYCTHLDGQKQLSENSAGEVEPDMSTLRDDSGSREYGVRGDGREVRFVDVRKGMDPFLAAEGDDVHYGTDV